MGGGTSARTVPASLRPSMPSSTRLCQQVFNNGCRDEALIRHDRAALGRAAANCIQSGLRIRVARIAVYCLSRGVSVNRPQRVVRYSPLVHSPIGDVGSANQYLNALRCHASIVTTPGHQGHA